MLHIYFDALIHSGGCGAVEVRNKQKKSNKMFVVIPNVYFKRILVAYLI